MRRQLKMEDFRTPAKNVLNKEPFAFKSVFSRRLAAVPCRYLCVCLVIILLLRRTLSVQAQLVHRSQAEWQRKKTSPRCPSRSAWCTRFA
jgi:hypothetical protein